MTIRAPCLAALAGLAALLLPLGSALAGDYADLEILGFSPDGKTFAFEEYGVQDGSGFPYSNIYVIDTASDDWVDGSPIRILEQTESAPVSVPRDKAHAQAGPILAARNVGASGNRVVSNPPTELSADPHHVIFIPRTPWFAGPASYDLQLTEIDLPPGDCPTNLAPVYRGFKLVLSTDAGTSNSISEDIAIPASRRCPLGYAISDVVTFFPDGRQPLLVTILSMFNLGFEGANRRFLAIASELPQ
jgi:predicted secreted protein